MAALPDNYFLPLAADAAVEEEDGVVGVADDVVCGEEAGVADGTVKHDAAGMVGEGGAKGRNQGIGNVLGPEDGPEVPPPVYGYNLRPH